MIQYGRSSLHNVLVVHSGSNTLLIVFYVYGWKVEQRAGDKGDINALDNDYVQPLSLVLLVNFYILPLPSHPREHGVQLPGIKAGGEVRIEVPEVEEDCHH